MFAKEQGWTLAIDQASNCAGVSLWYNGRLHSTTTLNSTRSTDPLPKRLQTQVPQLTQFLERQLPKGDRVSQVLFEGVRSRIVLVTVGAFLTCPGLAHCKVSAATSFVESSTWKYWAKRHGATGPVKDIKGIKALSETGFPPEQINLMSTDDEADSVLLYLAWREK